MDSITELGYGLPSAAQLTAARGYLGWSQETLAAKAGVGIATIKRVERASDVGSIAETLKLATIRAILEAYKNEGIVFARQGESELIICHQAKTLGKESEKSRR
jgi:transcriptional regulator with XRE-family HTH domain